LLSEKAAELSAPELYPKYWSEIKEAMPRENVVLQCVDCKERNYVTTKNKKKTPGRLEFRKYCPRCRQHKIHRETK
jgi:large subunit ribosomal protein L33